MASFPICVELTSNDIARVHRSWDQIRTLFPFWQRFIGPDTTVMDLGANIGLYTVWFAALAKYVHAVEGSIRNCDRLMKVCRVFNNVRIHSVAVDNICRCGETLFPDCCEESPQVQLVTFVRLDDYMLKHDIRPGFVKIDIEGMESTALLAMTNLICALRPVLQIEYHPGSRWMVPPPLGFDFSIFPSLGYGVYNVDMQPCEFSKHGQYFVIPLERVNVLFI